MNGSLNRLDYVLQLKKNLYSVNQVSYNYSRLFKARLLKINFMKNKVDSCVYYKESTICIKKIRL